MLTSAQFQTVITELVTEVTALAASVHGPFGGLFISLGLQLLTSFINTNEAQLLTALQQKGVVSQS